MHGETLKLMQHFPPKRRDKNVTLRDAQTHISYI